MRFAPSDRRLAARVEAADAANMFALAKAAEGSKLKASYGSFAGGTAVFAGVGSPLTHAMGIGFTGDLSEAEMERMEQFFRERGSACLIDLCPMAEPSVIAFVQSRPYRVIEFNNVMVRAIGRDEVLPDASVPVRMIQESEHNAWSRAVSEGFSEGAPVSDESIEMMSSVLSESHCWMAGPGHPLGGCCLSIRGDVALFYGDAILPSARGKGYQSALIAARLAHAQREGIELAAVSVLPGSGSQRNYERAGFQLVYMRVNVMREF